MEGGGGVRAGGMGGAHLHHPTPLRAVHRGDGSCLECGGYTYAGATEPQVTLPSHANPSRPRQELARSRGLQPIVPLLIM